MVYLDYVTSTFSTSYTVHRRCRNVFLPPPAHFVVRADRKYGPVPVSTTRKIRREARARLFGRGREYGGLINFRRGKSHSLD